MGIHRLNHAVLYVRDVRRTVGFYTSVLDFTVMAEIPGGRGAFLRAPDSTNDHDLGVFAMGEGAGDSEAGRRTVGLYHLAWEVGTLGELRDLAGRLADAGALVGASDHGTTKSLYAKDPDGLEMEVVWLVPAHLLHTVVSGPVTRPLDLAKELATYGEDTKGGLGVSIPIGVPSPV